jgi:hypothetical protein
MAETGHGENLGQTSINRRKVLGDTAMGGENYGAFK